MLPYCCSYTIINDQVVLTGRNQWQPGGPRPTYEILIREGNNSGFYFSFAHPNGDCSSVG